MTETKLLSADVNTLKEKVGNSDYLTARIVKTVARQAGISTIIQKIWPVVVYSASALLLSMILSFCSDYLFLMLSLLFSDSSIIIDSSSGLIPKELAAVSLELPLKDVFRFILKASLAVMPYILVFFTIAVSCCLQMDNIDDFNALELSHEK